MTGWLIAAGLIGIAAVLAVNIRDYLRARRDIEQIRRDIKGARRSLMHHDLCASRGVPGFAAYDPLPCDCGDGGLHGERLSGARQ